MSNPVNAVRTFSAFALGNLSTGAGSLSPQPYESPQSKGLKRFSPRPDLREIRDPLSFSLPNHLSPSDGPIPYICASQAFLSSESIPVSMWCLLEGLDPRFTASYPIPIRWQWLVLRPLDIGPGCIRQKTNMRKQRQGGTSDRARRAAITIGCYLVIAQSLQTSLSKGLCQTWRATPPQTTRARGGLFMKCEPFLDSLKPLLTRDYR